MGLIVEISVDMLKNKNITDITLFLSQLAIINKCNSEYYIYEMDGCNSKIERNACIQIVEFENPLTNYEKNNFINYITKIINNKTVNLDTIYKDNGSIDIVYNCIKSEFNNVNGKQKIIKNKPILNKIKELIYNY